MSEKLHAVFYTVLIVGVLGLAWSYMQEREDRAKMQATLQAQGDVIKQAQTDREQHARDDAARDAQTAATLAAMQTAVGRLTTPQQITGWSQKQLEDTIKGIQFSTPAPTAASPHPETQVTIPEASLPGLRDTIAKCQECQVKLTTAQADLESRLAQMKAADAEIQALKTERDTAVKAAKGTFAQRFGRALKWALIGGAAGYIAARH